MKTLGTTAIGPAGRSAAPVRRPRGFTLIEMLVVISIIVLLLGIVLLVGQGALSTARLKDTEVLIRQVEGAIDAFRNENPYRSVKPAQVRYGPNPPDDLMAFTGASSYGVGSGTSRLDMPNLMPGSRGTYCVAAFNPCDVITDHWAPTPPASYVALGDIKALVWTLRSRPDSRALYDAISDRFKVTVDSSTEFFDMNKNEEPDPQVDGQVQYLIDSWGQPLRYYAVRAAREDEQTTHAAVAGAVVALNKNQPVVMSYGRDGANQLEAGQTLEAQYFRNCLSGSPQPQAFDSPMNEDNVFLDETLALKLNEVPCP